MLLCATELRDPMHLCRPGTHLHMIDKNSVSESHFRGSVYTEHRLKYQEKEGGKTSFPFLPELVINVCLTYATTVLPSRLARGEIRILTGMLVTVVSDGRSKSSRLGSGQTGWMNASVVLLATTSRPDMLSPCAPSAELMRK